MTSKVVGALMLFLVRASVVAFGVVSANSTLGIPVAQGFNLEAFDEYLKRMHSPVIRVEDIYDAERTWRDNVARSRTEAMRRGLERAENAWEYEYKTMEAELERERNFAAQDAELRRIAAWLGLAASALSAAAELANSFGGEGGAKEDSLKTVELPDNMRLRETTTKLVEMCETSGGPCMMIGTEKLVRVSAYKADAPRSGFVERIVKDTTSAVEAALPGALGCIGTNGECYVSEGPNRHVREGWLEYEGEIYETPKLVRYTSGEDAKDPGAGSWRRDVFKRVKAAVPEIGSIGLEFTPIADGYRLRTGKDLITGEKASRIEAGAGFIVGSVTGPVGKIALKSAKGLWKLGRHKSVAKWVNRFRKRGWSSQQVDEAIEKGIRHKAPNRVIPNNGATRYEFKKKSVVIDNKTRELLHVGGEGFGY